MPMPEDHMAGHGPPGVSHADCTQVIEVLKTAFVQGRLTKDEFGSRVGQAFTSQTYAELAEVTADLPAGLRGARPPRQRDRSRPRLSMNTVISAGAFGMIAVLAVMLVGIVTGSVIAVLSAAASIAIVGALSFGVMMIVSWYGSARQPGEERAGRLSGVVHLGALVDRRRDALHARLELQGQVVGVVARQGEVAAVEP